MKTLNFTSLLALGFTCGLSHATTITTGFESGSNALFADGTRTDITLTDNTAGANFSTTFRGGVALTRFDGPSYHQGSSAYFFVRGGGFNGTFNRGPLTPTGADGQILFGGNGASNVSFWAANRRNGPGITVTAFDSLDNAIGSSQLVSASSFSRFTFDADPGSAIARLQFDLPRASPTPNPPYVLALDTFSATSATTVPEPSAALLGALGLLALANRRTRK